MAPDETDDLDRLTRHTLLFGCDFHILATDKDDGR